MSKASVLVCWSIEGAPVPEKLRRQMHAWAKKHLEWDEGSRALVARRPQWGITRLMVISAYAVETYWNDRKGFAEWNKSRYAPWRTVLQGLLLDAGTSVGGAWEMSQEYGEGEEE